ncbi:hypothetical protein M422DRAFT_276278 [Sphaerobolus stellatus SS14]|uniref:Uncharacterized protein n=1 Tax=Sphaerobolus stellatus (strain SS14) TaxID=990650 RepID=A0A0C9TMV7_SPHS4|nr:hypothetical protein M422DRAFT_276278 [Sphaerobolus stellatus SS14]
MPRFISMFFKEPEAMEGYEHWKYDFEPFRELFHQDMDQNAAEHESPLGYAVSFYNSIKHETAPMAAIVMDIQS